MKITVPSAILWAALSQTVLGQEVKTYGMINLSGPDINDAYPAASSCISLPGYSPQLVDVIQIQASIGTQCTFYAHPDCEGEQTALITESREFDDEPIEVGSWKCTLSE